jgi:PBP1b-binding outer membrane lipoprotein LpoB
MATVKYVTMALTVLFIAGCSAPPEPPAPKTKTVFDPLTSQLDHARDVQKTIDESAERNRKAVEKQERGDN